MYLANAQVMFLLVYTVSVIEDKEPTYLQHGSMQRECNSNIEKQNT